jgi:signal transduction histidine kinase
LRDKVEHYSQRGTLRESLGEGTCELSTLNEGCGSVLNATRSPLLRYGVAVLTTGLALLLLQVLLIPWFGVEPDASPFMMFFAAVIDLHQRLQAFTDDHPPGSEVREEELDRTLVLAQEMVRESRRVIEGLRPSALDDFGLTIALRMWGEELEKSEGLQVGWYEDDLGEERLPVEAETALYRVAQEALTNISKHARTKKAYLTLERLEPGKVCLQVSDEGRGFDPLAKAPGGGGGGPGERVGLTSMQERVSLLGGELRIRSRPGAGTSMIAEVPLPASSEEEGGNEHNAG